MRERRTQSSAKPVRSNQGSRDSSGWEPQGAPQSVRPAPPRPAGAPRAGRVRAPRSSAGAAAAGPSRPQSGSESAERDERGARGASRTGVLSCSPFPGGAVTPALLENWRPRHLSVTLLQLRAACFAPAVSSEPHKQLLTAARAPVPIYREGEP